MRDQIKNLSRSQKLTACQIANHLHVSKNIVVQTLKDDFSCLHYQFRIEYLGHEHKGNAEPLKGWFREIQVKGDMTLNGLNDCIQHVLGWDNTHCYIFAVHEKHYAYLGEDDDFVVEDVFENHCSTKIPIYLLSLCDRLIYNSDFGGDHFFLLTVSGIERANGSSLPRVIGARGKDMFQDQLAMVCACCRCCCGVLRSLNEFGNRNIMTRSAFSPVRDPALCKACRVCADKRCPMSAIEITAEIYRFKAERCLGCGLCATGCPNDAISMKRTVEVQVPPANAQEWGLRLLMDHGRLEGFMELMTPKAKPIT
jgi:Pyruvate/2-oxoacid:ferredoxin oxidoreductase delta subunit